MTRNNLFFLLLCIGLVAMISVASVLLIVVVDHVYAQIAVVRPSIHGPLLEDESYFSLNVTYWNGTQAILNETVINFAASDQIVQFINAIIANEGDELPIQDLDDILALEQEQIEESEVIEEDSEDSNDDNNDSNGDDNNDQGDEDPPDNNTDPIEEPPFESGGGGEFAIMTDGCFGGGYYADDPDPKCYPITDDGKLQTEPEEDTAYCAALGYFFNPPSKD